MGAEDNNSLFRKGGTLCWECIHAVPDKDHGCSWSRDFIPVDGWTARKSKGLQASYTVIYCPEFEEK